MYQVCDEPHPVLIKDMLQHCVDGKIDDAYKIMAHLWRLGYSAEDIITIVFRVCKNHNMPEFLKLEFIKVSASWSCTCWVVLSKGSVLSCTFQPAFTWPISLNAFCFSFLCFHRLMLVSFWSCPHSYFIRDIPCDLSRCTKSQPTHDLCTATGLCND